MGLLVSALMRRDVMCVGGGSEDLADLVVQVLLRVLMRLLLLVHQRVLVEEEEEVVVAEKTSELIQAGKRSLRGRCFRRRVRASLC